MNKHETEAQKDPLNPQKIIEEEALDIPAFLKKPFTVFAEAENIVSGDREKTYGHPAKNLEATGILWQAHILAKYGISINITAEDVAWMMTQLKQARNMHMHKRDNIVDGIGYIGLVQKIHDFNYAPAKTATEMHITGLGLHTGRISVGVMGDGHIHEDLLNFTGAKSCNENATASLNPSSAQQSDSASPSESSSSSSQE
jgi:hypothetical protein